MTGKTFAQLFSNREQRFIDTLLLVAFCSVIYWLSAQPSLSITVLFTWQDKIQHAIEYFMLAVLAWRCFRHFTVKPALPLWGSLIFCSLYGISDEWHQYYVPGRTTSIADWIADVLGAALAVGVLRNLPWLSQKYADAARFLD